MSTEGGSNQGAAARSRGDLAQLRRLARFLIPYRQQLLLAMLALTTASACVLALGGHQDAVQDVAFSPDGGMLLTGSDDGTARVFSLAAT